MVINILELGGPGPAIPPVSRVNTHARASRGKVAIYVHAGFTRPGLIFYFTRNLRVPYVR